MARRNGEDLGDGVAKVGLNPRDGGAQVKGVCSDEHSLGCPTIVVGILHLAFRFERQDDRNGRFRCPQAARLGHAGLVDSINRGSVADDDESPRLIVQAASRPPANIDDRVHELGLHGLVRILANLSNAAERAETIRRSDVIQTATPDYLFVHSHVLKHSDTHRNG
jgi:hypothetical protein